MVVGRAGEGLIVVKREVAAAPRYPPHGWRAMPTRTGIARPRDRSMSPAHTWSVPDAPRSLEIFLFRRYMGVQRSMS